MEIQSTASYGVSLSKAEAESIVFSLSCALPSLLKDPIKHQAIIELSNNLLLALNSQEYSNEAQ